MSNGPLSGSTSGHIEEDAAGELAGALKGSVLTPGGPGYEEARRIWNGTFDRYPVAIAGQISCSRLRHGFFQKGTYVMGGVQ